MSAKKVKAVKMYQQASGRIWQYAEKGLSPVFILPATPEAYEAIVQQGARALDGLAFHEYKPGECLPRGHEMDGVEKVNEVQGFRRRSAISRAKKVLAAIGITPNTKKE
jgi:hypothetical protein